MRSDYFELFFGLTENSYSMFFGWVDARGGIYFGGWGEYENYEKRGWSVRNA
jgi:hypothetical protein